ncbi:MAG: dTDP-4-dehydrorhamnose reductase [Treponema sp.]|nr:dTDP-4-dehydrorhamnose reductase [Treponema sp.]
MIWLIGSKGMLGTEIARQLELNNINYVGTDKEVDITNIENLENFVKSVKNIRWIINCSAYTAVDKAEEETELAQLLNETGVKNIALIAKKINSKLIHISTDYVFDGTSLIPYKETDKISPLGIYGITKAAGEKAVSEVLNEYYIIRTAWLYGYDGKNFVYTMLKLMNAKNEIKVVNDQFGSPTFTADLAYSILRIILCRGIDFDLPNPPEYGIYHCTNLGQISWFDFAKEIYKIGKENNLISSICNIMPCSTEEYPTKTKRPSYSVLNKDKIQKTLDFKLPYWNESLRIFLLSPLFKNEFLL